LCGDTVCKTWCVCVFADSECTYVVTLPLIREQSIVMSMSVCVSLCGCVCVCVFLSVMISSVLHIRSLTKSFVHVICGRGSVLLWWCSDKLCTSIFMDDIIFICSSAKVGRPRRPAEVQCTCSLGHGCKLCAVILVAGQRMHGTTFQARRVTSQVATLGAESAVYDSVIFCV